MRPELLAATERLAQAGLLAPEDAARLRRVARRELVSVRTELRLLLTAGILTIATGAGLFVKENAGRLGTLVIAGTLTLAAAAALAFAFRGAPRFTWERAPDRGALCDAALVLGALLLASDLAYLETRHALLGPSWAYHLLLVACVYALLAYRYDSRPLLSMALTSFAAWRGLSRDLPFDALFDAGASFRVNALLCSLVFAAGAWHASGKRKAHFEPVFSSFAILLLLAALVNGAFRTGRFEHLWLVLLFGIGAGVVLLARKKRRALWLAQGAGAVWLGALRASFELLDDKAALLLAAVLSLAFFAFVVREMRALKEDA